VEQDSRFYDSRFYNQNKKLLAKLSFPPSFDQKVDLTKVKREVIGQWITERVTQLLGFEDDIVVAMIINLLEPKVDERVDPRQLQLTITGFLEKDAPAFMEELWGLLLSAQAHPTGIPPAILEKKKQEMAQAAQDKRALRDVLDRKRHDAAAARPAAKTAGGRGDARGGKQPAQSYGLIRPNEQRTGRGSERDGAGGHGRGQGREPSSRRERSRSRDGRRAGAGSRRGSSARDRRRARSRSRSASLSRSRSRSLSRSTSRSRSRRPRGSRPRRSGSRSHSRERSRRPRARR
jgi:serine/arginine repetitive matrix protein 1